MTVQFKQSDIYARLKELQAITQQIKKVEQASKEIQFHLNRY